MSQHDFVIGNDTGASVRADINAALAAIISQSSGATEPSTMYAYQFWADTTLGLLKIRNAANSAWVTIGTLASANLGLLPLAGGTMTGALLAVVGGLTTPGISFAGDANTGFYWVSADKFALVVGGVAMMTYDAATYAQFNGTSAFLVPIGTTAQRPAGTNGLVRYNSDLTRLEVYSGGSWVGLGVSVQDVVQTKTTTYTALSTDDLILGDTSGGGWTLSLPSSASVGAGKKYKVKKTTNDANALTIDANSTETIDGVLTFALYTQYDSVEIETDGSNWYVI